MMKQKPVIRTWVVAAVLMQLPLPAAADSASAIRVRAAYLAQIELALDAMGYSIDPPDGLPDPRTAAALAAFLGRHGLPEATPAGAALAAMARAAADLQQAERRVRADLRRAAEERLVRYDLARPATEQLAVADPPAQR
jgi:peptidoglycan hydrolase-like protein with peptidoglycan-binding domain